MKKLAIAIAAIALMGTPAFAQVPPPAPVYNWTGWYAGVNAGASFGSAKTDFSAPATVAVSIPGATGSSTFGFAGSDRTYPSGFIGGGQIGYNYQWSPHIVVGLEADFQGALERDSNTLTNTFSGPISVPGVGVLGGAGFTVLDYQTKIDWFGTVRLRAGYLWGNGNVLSYVTGGLAYGKVDLEGTSQVSGTSQGFTGFPVSVTQVIGHSQVNTGWVVGYGTEGKLLIPGWTWKIEGLYMDLGTLDTTGASGVATVPGLSLTAGQVTTHTHFTDGILRAGLNYKFY
jgi:outer membrane immunogenic protein